MAFAQQLMVASVMFFSLLDALKRWEMMKQKSLLVGGSPTVNEILVPPFGINIQTSDASCVN